MSLREKTAQGVGRSPYSMLAALAVAVIVAICKSLGSPQGPLTVCMHSRTDLPCHLSDMFFYKKPDPPRSQISLARGLAPPCRRVSHADTEKIARGCRVHSAHGNSAISLPLRHVAPYSVINACQAQLASNWDCYASTHRGLCLPDVVVNFCFGTFYR